MSLWLLINLSYDLVNINIYIYIYIYNKLYNEIFVLKNTNKIINVEGGTMSKLSDKKKNYHF